MQSASENIDSYHHHHHWKKPNFLGYDEEPSHQDNPPKPKLSLSDPGQSKNSPRNLLLFPSTIPINTVYENQQKSLIGTTLQISFLLFKHYRQILSFNQNIKKNSSADWSVWNLRGKAIKTNDFANLFMREIS